MPKSPSEEGELQVQSLEQLSTNRPVEDLAVFVGVLETDFL